MSILNVEPFENGGDESVLAKTDAGTVIVAVVFDAEKLACRAEIGNLVLFREPGLNFNHSFGSVFWV